MRDEFKQCLQSVTYACVSQQTSQTNSFHFVNNTQTMGEVTTEEIEDQKGDDNLGVECTLELFSEANEVISLIEDLPNIYNAPLSEVERAYEKYYNILNQYQEQPHLLDSHIDQLLEKLISIVRDSNNPIELKHAAFKYMYVITKVREYKVIIRHLPHETSDFEPILKLLESQDPADTNTWTTRYILLLWLSIIIKIPFHMSRLDDSETNDKTIMSRMFDICKTYVVVGDKSSDAAAFLSSQFLTRVDIKDVYLSPFLDWACELVNSPDSHVCAKQGALFAVAMITKHGKREDLLPHAGRLLRWIFNTDYKDVSGTKIPKYGFKIVQRIGLIFLRPHLAPWRYQRGSRILSTNLSAGDSTKKDTPLKSDAEIEDTNNIDVPEEIEEVIDELLQGLRSGDRIVRWSAAKGIGRVSGRLPKDMADDVLSSILELFDLRESDGAWHGACLTLAELGRRGLLLPQRLPVVIPYVLKALVYDELRGYASVGSDIRDAACYVCWAFARAYDVNDLKPYVTDIARALLVVTVFDREINCRRAASAAFQENVGRQGTFPHGIDILTVADFFAVGMRTNAYLNISVYIAQFKEYTTSLIDHLVSRKVDHWDTAIRELTSKALFNLTPKAPEYMADVVLEKLFVKTKTIDLNARHGAILAIGEILHALYLISVQQQHDSIASLISEDILQKVKDLIVDFRNRNLFRGLGGELMKQACSTFIQKCALSRMPYHNTPVIDEWLSLLNECLSYEVATVRLAAIDALPMFFNEYYSDKNQTEKRNKITQEFIDHLKEHNKIVRMGYVLAIGSLPAFMLIDNFDYIIDSVIKVTEITDDTLKWAESRRDALKAIGTIIVTCATEKDISSVTITRIYNCFLTGLNEYTQDNRGDIGAWVREATISSIQAVTLKLAKTNPDVLTRDLLSKLLAGIAQQAVEKIDRTRAVAAKVFYSLLHSNPSVPNIPYHDELQSIFPADTELINWNSELVAFPKFVHLLPYEEFTYNILLGFIVSIGGLTETLIKVSSTSLFSYLNNLIEKNQESEIIRYCNVILDIFTKYQKVDRITIAMFRFFEKLVTSGCIQCVLNNDQLEFDKQMLKLIQLEITGCRDIYKLIDGIGALCQFIQIPRMVCGKALTQISILLCHRHTYVRKACSARLYEALLVYGENSTIPLENLDEVMTIVGETNWENSSEELRPIRNHLCELMKVGVPILKKKT